MNSRRILARLLTRMAVFVFALSVIAAGTILSLMVAVIPSPIRDLIILLWLSASVSLFGVVVWTVAKQARLVFKEFWRFNTRDFTTERNTPRLSIAGFPVSDRCQSSKIDLPKSEHQVVVNSINRCLVNLGWAISVAFILTGVLNYTGVISRITDVSDVPVSTTVAAVAPLLGPVLGSGLILVRAALLSLEPRQIVVLILILVPPTIYMVPLIRNIFILIQNNVRTELVDVSSIYRELVTILKLSIASVVLLFGSLVLTGTILG